MNLAERNKLHTTSLLLHATCIISKIETVKSTTKQSATSYIIKSTSAQCSIVKSKHHEKVCYKYRVNKVPYVFIPEGYPAGSKYLKVLGLG